MRNDVKILMAKHNKILVLFMQLSNTGVSSYKALLGVSPPRGELGPSSFEIVAFWEPLNPASRW